MSLLKDMQKQRFIGFVLVFIMLFASLYPASSFASTNKINYVALGDSLAAGQIPGSLFDKGYTGVIADYLEENNLLESYTNDFAISGYTTKDVLDDILNNIEILGKKNNGVLKDADLITITAGANDLFRELSIDKETGKVTFDPKKAVTVIASIRVNLSSILGKIKEMNPDAKVYISGYYNAFPYLPEGQQLLLTKVITGLNGVIKQVADRNGATFVGLENIFGETPTTYLYPSDIYPTQEGYDLMGTAFIKAMTEKQTVEFIDVPENYWAYNDIHLLVDLNIITGVSENTFEPDTPITRAEAAQVLYRAVPFDQSVPPNPEFNDIPEDHEAYYAIAKLTQAGVFAKVHEFYPDRPLTRAEMAKILVLAFNLDATGQSEFTDVSETYWAKNMIDRLVASKITFGYPNGTFQPQTITSRAQFTAFIVRAMKKDNIESIIPN